MLSLNYSRDKTVHLPLVDRGRPFTASTRHGLVGDPKRNFVGHLQGLSSWKRSRVGSLDLRLVDFEEVDLIVLQLRLDSHKMSL